MKEEELLMMVWRVITYEAAWTKDNAVRTGHPCQLGQDRSPLLVRTRQMIPASQDSTPPPC